MTATKCNARRQYSAMHDGKTMQAMTQYTAMDDNARHDGNTVQCATAIQCNARRQYSAMHDGNT
eukprot:5084378-Pleurochrysis_carterae.AAC.1